MQEELTLEGLYDAYSKTVYWAARGVVHDADLAADVMQNVFLSAHRHMQTLASLSPAQCRAWLYRSAVNGAIDMLRRNKRIVPTENAGEGEADKAAGPEAAAEESEMRAVVQQALASLPETYKRPLYLYYFAQMGYKEICELLDMNEGTLKSRMSRGRALMEKALQKGGGKSYYA